MLFAAVRASYSSREGALHVRIHEHVRKGRAQGGQNEGCHTTVPKGAMVDADTCWIRRCDAPIPVDDAPTTHADGSRPSWNSQRGAVRTWLAYKQASTHGSGVSHPQTPQHEPARLVWEAWLMQGAGIRTAAMSSQSLVEAVIPVPLALTCRPQRQQRCRGVRQARPATWRLAGEKPDSKISAEPS